jgi:hypothetical protein
VQRRHPKKSSRKLRSGLPASREIEPAGNREVAEAASGAPLELEGLPESYDQTRVVLLPVDPYLVHVYWEIAPRDEEQARRRARSLRFQATLRFYDITHSVSDRSNAQTQFDVDIDLGPGKWYVHLWSPEKRYFVDLGLRTEDGRFVPIARSNVVHTPRAQPSTNVDEHYMPIAVDPQRQPDVRAPHALKQQTADQQELPEIESFKAAAMVPDREKTRITLPIDMAESVRRELAELYGLQHWPAPPLRRDAHPGSVTELYGLQRWPAPPLRRDAHPGSVTELYGRQHWPAPSLRRDSHPGSVVAADFFDLTEMNERNFAAGISSGKS